MTDRKLKILYHHRTVAKDGQNVHIEEMLKAFRAQGHQVHVVAPYVDNPNQSTKTGLLSFMKKFIPAFLYELIELSYSIRAYLKLKSAYDEFQPDIFYERNNLFLLSGKWLKAKTGIPFILEVNAPLADERHNHGHLSLYNFAKSMEAKVWNSADALIPVSQALADIVMQAGVRPELIHVMHNGIDPDKFPGDLSNAPNIQQDLALEGKTILGFTGYVRDWHKLDQVIQVIADDNGKHNLHMLVIGDGPDVPPCKMLAEKLSVSDRVSFVGIIGREQVAAYVSLFDIALQPAVTDYASPLKIFEYLALGKAIIAPSQPNICEILTDGKESLLFDPDQEDSFKLKLIELIENKDFRQIASKEAMRTIEEKNFYWTHNADRTASIGYELMDLN